MPVAKSNLLHHMTHDAYRFAGFAVLEVDHDGVLSGFAAKEVDGVILFVGAGVV